MRHRQGPVALAIAAAALLPGAAAPQTAAGDGASANVTIEASSLRNHRGVVRACLTSQAERFPDCTDPARSRQAVGDAAAGMVLVFRDVPPGRYAVALLHDENGNGKADRAAMMIPREGFGFSRDAKVRFGPPRFGDAAFTLAPGAREKLVIRMRYML